MTHIVRHIRNLVPLPTVPTYIGVCCKEWVLAIGARGRCGLCGEVPTYLRPDDGSPDVDA